MDNMSGITLGNGYDSILIIVNQLSKVRHHLPCHTPSDAKQTATLNLQQVHKLYDLPTYKTSDKGTQFTSKFWTDFCQQLRIKAGMSNAYHLERDGHKERLNTVIE